MLVAFITAVGKQGSGKTTKVRALVERCRRALFADPEAKWPLRPGDIEVRGAHQLLECVGDLGATDPAVPFRIVYRDDALAMATAAPATAFALKNLTLVVDEAAWLMTPWDPPTSYFKRCYQFGRERRINLVVTTREPQEVNNMAFSQANIVYIFHMEPGNGLDRIKKWYRPLAEVAPTLGFHEYRVHGDERYTQLLGREGLALPKALLHPLKHNTRGR